MDSKNLVCLHCGPTPVNHFAEKLSVRLDHLLKPFQTITIAWLIFWSKIFKGALMAYLVYAIFWTFQLIGLGRFIAEPDIRMNYRTKVLWEAAKRKNVVMLGFLFLQHPVDVLFARKDGKFIVFDALPRPLGKVSKSMYWMDNKGLTRNFLQKNGLPVAKGGKFSSLKKGVKLFSQLSKPVIVKPSEGSRSRHTTINIFGENELVQAIKVAKQLSPWYILEEQLEGFVYRATVIGHKVVGVIRRLPPGVYGNGRNTLKELVDLENQNPLRKGPIFHELEIGEDAEKEMIRQYIKWTDVPEDGRFISLHPKVGRSSGAGNIDVTDVAHPDNKILFESVANLMNDDLIGIDFIIGDISKSWKEQSKCGVIECNSLPFIDLHHYPLVGLPRDAAGALWDVVFSNEKKSIS